MPVKKTLLIITILFSSVFSTTAIAQIAVRGRVYDQTLVSPLSGVSVLSSSGKATMSDTLGYYKLVLSEADSIWFSYLGKETPRYAVRNLQYPLGFDISIKAKSDLLPGVTIWRNSARFDSMENRRAYAKIFNFQKPGFNTSTSNPNSGNVGVGVDINELINVFSFRKNKRMANLQNRLIQDEQDKYVDSRFSKIVVQQLTKIHADSINVFMNIYRPDYHFTINVNEAELGIYIQQAYRAFVTGQKISKEMLQIRVMNYDF